MNATETSNEQDSQSINGSNSHSQMLIGDTNDGEISLPSTANTIVEIVRQQRFDVGPRYTDLKFIGEGAYGKLYEENLYFIKLIVINKEVVLKQLYSY